MDARAEFNQLCQERRPPRQTFSEWVRGDVALKRMAEICRADVARSVEARFGPFDPAHLEALVRVPREQFVPEHLICESVLDAPLPLDDLGSATISAPHAYLLSYRLVGLTAGDSLIELGTGSGYGAALAAYIVGPGGRVLTFEIDEALAALSAENLEGYGQVQSVYGDAMASTPYWHDFAKVVCTFAVSSIPEGWCRALSEGSVIVLPVGRPRSDQILVRAERKGGDMLVTEHGAVRYVSNRSRLA